ncbi:MAG: hypothetical protein CL574_08245 [Altererythrobacter sp.]|nr:hypothetical protein [Altererythrobacter sp.]|tara:strand:- start:20290 stop:23283 length:2994 start_codon:yes stop_codon:yes gene_type:complete
MAETLFRFLVVDTVSKDGAAQVAGAARIESSDIVERLLSARGSRTRLATVEAGLDKIADRGLDEMLPDAPWAEALKERARSLLTAADIAPDERVAAVTEAADALAGDHGDAIGGNEWQTLRIALGDTLMARRVRPPAASGGRGEVELMFRMMAMMERAGDHALDEDAVRALIQRPIYAPALKSLRDILARLRSPQTRPARRVEPETPAGVAAIREDVITRALHDIMRLPASALQSRIEQVEPETVVRVRRATPPPRATISGSGRTRVSVRAADDGETVSLGNDENFQAKYVVSAQGARELSSATRDVLRSMSIDPVGKTLGNLYGAVVIERRTATDLFLGGQVAGFGLLSNIPMLLNPIGPLVISASGSTEIVPSTYGSIEPIGFGSLFVVKQHITGYEGGEVAHVENVVPGESKRREHRRRTLVEELYEQETETGTEEERDQQSTERFELKAEARETIKEETRFKADLSVRAKYGPAIEIGVNTGVGFDSSRETATARASSFAKETVDRAVSKVSEKVREKRSRLSREEIEEIAVHELTAEPGGPGVSAVFQWLDKLYEAQTYRYDGRQIFDFSIPEPGAFVYRALQMDLAVEDGVPPPPSFHNRSGAPLQVADVNEADYTYYAALFQAGESVSAPPDPVRVVSDSVAFEGSAGDEDEDTQTTAGIAKTKRLSIPAGYAATHASVVSIHSAPQMFVTVGAQIFPYDAISGRAFGALAIDDEPIVGNVEVSVVSPRPAMAAVTVHVACRLTDNALQAWQVDTFAALQQAHRLLVSSYQEKLAAKAIAQGLVVTGSQRRMGRQVVIDELKKACITMLTAQHFDAFGAIETDASGYPHMDLDKAQKQAEYARFFEQAFEWEHLNYVLYPYFWGRKSEWVRKLHFTSADDELAELVRSGAGRVVVPVRPGFEGAVRVFLDSGEIWSGGSIPLLEDDDFFGIADEIHARTAGEGEDDGTPAGDPWTIRVPTSLVILRDANAGLPEWERDEEGRWRARELAP